MTGHFGGTLGAHRILDLLREQIERVGVDLATLAGAAHTANDLFATERFGDAAALHHRQNRGFDCGEPAPTLRAGTPPPDGGAFLGFT
ncbi:hypothetical protein JMUB6875_07040 [Nocardia sp. JMUB6875]